MMTRCATAWFAALMAWLALLPASPAFADPAGPRANEAVYRNVQFNHLTTDDGLSQNIVYDIIQDRRGYVWIGTQEGLNRYDGYEVERYEHLKNDPATLSHDFVRALLVDRDGVLWIGTESGINRYDEASDSFQRRPFAAAGLPGLEEEPVRVMLQTSNGSYWVGTSNSGLARVDLYNRTFRWFRPGEGEHGLGDAAVLALHEDSKGNLWVGTQQAGLFRFDPVGDRFISYSDNAEEGRGLAGREVRSLYEDRFGMLWVGTADAGLSRFDPKRGTFERFTDSHERPNGLKDSRVRDITEDSRGSLWVATDGGLSEWRRDSQGFVTYGHRAADTRSLVSDRVNTLFVDASGVLWVGTWDGVSKWNYFSDTFTYYSAENGMLPGNVVTSVAEARDGTLWVATYGNGLARLDIASQQVETFLHDPSDPASLPDDRVMVVHVDTRNQVWVGTRSSGIARLDQEAARFERFTHDPSDPTSLGGNAVSSLHSDQNGTLWVGTFGAGLSRTSAADPGVFQRYLNDPGDPGTISGDKVITLFSDRDGNLWVGTEDEGLNRYVPEAEAFERYKHFETQSGPLHMHTPTDLLEDREGGLWIGTLGDGLVRWPAADRLANRLESRPQAELYGKSQGLPTDTIYGIVEDQNGALWISSNRGLTRFDPGESSTRQFDSRNGLRDSEFHQGARLRSRTGRLLFGGATGLVGFFPGELPVNDRAPSVAVTARSRQEELASTATGDAPPVIEVGYIDRFIAFDFVALDFMSPDKNQYRYRLSGFEEDWVEADSFRRAIYTNLPPGHYTFQVQAANNDGVWNREGAAVEVEVIPAPWNTWWAYTIYIALFASGLALYVRGERAKLRREAEQRALLEKEVEERTQELAQRNADLESLNDRLAEASVTDSLTGLRNRRYVDQFISSEIARLKRNRAGDHDTTDHQKNHRIMFFMMIDLDGFKLINDRYGHHAGDLALTQVKDALSHCSRESDTLVRWGGDEFMVIGFDAGFFGAKALAERIRQAIADRDYDVGNGNVGQLSASIGIAPYPLVEDQEDFCSWEQVTAVADAAAYIAKANGRNAWVSIAGTQQLTAEVLADVGTELRRLESSGLVEIDSSIRGPLKIPGDEPPEPRAAAAG